MSSFETRNVVWRKKGGEEGHEGQRQNQELNNRICSHNVGLETTTQTFMLHARPNPLCAWTSVKRSPHWSCDESKKALFSGHLASFLVCTRKFIWMYAFLFAYVCMCHTSIRTWTTSELRPSVRTQVHDTCVHSWRNMVSQMTQSRFHVSCTHVNSCAHTKSSQIVWQTHEIQPNSLTKGLFWTDHRTDVLPVSSTPMHVTVLGVLETSMFVR